MVVRGVVNGDGPGVDFVFARRRTGVENGFVDELVSTSSGVVTGVAVDVKR